jgi:cytochrome c peroxidase
MSVAASPTTLNAALFQSMFWDGRAPTLEEQAKLPILNPIEMGHPDPASAMRAVGSDALYKDMGARTHQSRYFRLCLD